MMNAFVTEIKLRQHTPIIHFQHDQVGATLRATELKPKLDTFIMARQLQKENLPFNLFESVSIQGEEVRKFVNVREAFGRATKLPTNKWRNWLAGKGQAPHVALDYKVVIVQHGDVERYVVSSMPYSKDQDPERERLAQKVHHASYLGQTQYFADNEHLKNEKEMESARLGLLSKGLIEVRITSNVPDLLEQVKASLRPFFCANAFGTRQSKGFGVFLPDGIQEAELLQYLRNDRSVTGIFKYQQSPGTWQSKLQKIGSDYGKMKRGYSNPMRPQDYEKSQLWSYLCSEGDISWEKRKIKHFLIDNHRSAFQGLKHESSTHHIDSCGEENQEGMAENYMYVRALLGLAEQFEFAKRDKTKLRVKVADSLEGNTALKEYALDRFKSPIRYIITADAIYLITTKIDPLLHTYPHPETGIPTARRFTFKVDGVGSPNSFTLAVPTDFDLPHFISQLRIYGSNRKNP